MDFWIILLTSFLGVIIWYYNRKLFYFKRHGIPHKTPWPFIGNMAAVFRRKVHFIECLSTYSDFWPDAKYSGFYMLAQPTIIIRDIELIKEITIKQFDSFHDHQTFISEEADPLFGRGLVNLKGTKWKETRAILSPAFTGNKMKHMFKLMNTCARNFSEFVCKSVDESNPDIEIKDAFSKYTIDVIATCAFGVTTNSLKNPNNEFYVLGKKVFETNFIQSMKIMLSNVMPVVNKIFDMRVFDSKLRNFFYGLVQNAVETRKKEGIVRPDMLQLMMESEDKNGQSQLDISDMTSQAFIFFLGGFETASSLMSYTAIELAKNKDIQDRLIEEIDTVMLESNGDPSYEAINNMPFLEALLYETLRFYPITGVLDRVCVKDFELPPTLPGHKPYTLKKGDKIWIPSHAIHNDPQYYENPEKFDPDRFLDKKMNISNPYYLGFGIGPRSCIGNRFALLENKLVLFYLLHYCKLEMSSKLKQPITYKKDSFIALIEGGFWVKLIKREKKDK